MRRDRATPTEWRRWPGAMSTASGWSATPIWRRISMTGRPAGAMWGRPMLWGICCSPAMPSGRIRPARWSCTSRRHRPDTWALCGRWAGAIRRGRAAKRTRPRPLTASGAAPRAETVRRRCRWGTAMKRAAAARRMPPKRLTGTRRRPAGACRWGSTIWAACTRQDRASHGIGGRHWSCTVRRHRRSRRLDRRSGGWKKPVEPGKSWAGCWWPMPCSWEQDYGRAAPVTGSSGWRQWPLRRWPEGAAGPGGGSGRRRCVAHRLRRCRCGDHAAGRPAEAPYIKSQRGRVPNGTRPRCI